VSEEAFRILRGDRTERPAQRFEISAFRLLASAFSQDASFFGEGRASLLMC
jgi:hypothetical protein